MERMFRMRIAGDAVAEYPKAPAGPVPVIELSRLNR